MKNKTMYRIVISQGVILILFMFLTFGNEILDIPHYIFNDVPTTYNQRFGEIIIESIIFLFVISIQVWLLRRLYKRVRLLEGFIPICANCKKIRNPKDQWEQIETYITQHSLAQFSHGICPDCAKKLYPGFDVDGNDFSLKEKSQK